MRSRLDLTLGQRPEEVLVVLHGELVVKVVVSEYLHS